MQTVQINLIKDVVQGYFDKHVYSTKFAIGSNYYQTDYASFEIITNLNVKQTEILIKLSEIKEVGFSIITVYILYRILFE